MILLQGNKGFNRTNGKTHKIKPHSDSMNNFTFGNIILN